MRLDMSRHLETKDATLGIIEFEETRLFTLELPDRSNQRDVSCIPSNDYEMRLMEDRKRIRLHNPPLVTDSGYTEWESSERFNCDIHVGNYVSEIKGCILVGLGAQCDPANGGISLIDSAEAMDILLTFVKEQGDARCILEIRDAY